MTRLVRYALVSVAAPTAAWVAFLCALFYLVGFLKGIDVMLGSAVGPVDVLGLFALLTPQYVVQVAPIAVVLGTVQGLGRLADDGELTAAQAAGLSPARLAWAPVMVGVATVMILAVISQTIQPLGVRLVRQRVVELIERNAVTDVRPGQFYEGLEGLTVYVESIVAGRWQHVMLSDSRAGTPVLLLAQWAQPTSTAGLGLTFELKNGSLHTDDGRRTALAAQFESGTVRADLGLARAQAGSFRFVREEASLADLALEISRLNRDSESPRAIELILHERLRQVLVPLGLAVVAAAVALRRRIAGGTASAIAVTIALSVIYHVVARATQSAGERGSIEPWLAGATPNLAALLLGGLGLRQLHRRGV